MTLKHRIFSLLIALIASVTCIVSASAKEVQPLGMVTGQVTGTYIAIGNDIARVAPSEGMTLEVKPSNGSIDNIRRIAEAKENAALGIVQSDVLGFLKRSKNPRSKQIAERLRLVFPFYAEEVHVLARKDIADFKGLSGKRVVIGQQGSGNMLTAMNLLTLTNVKPARILQIAPDQGVVAVLAGEADAVIFTAGKPVTLFRNLEQVRSDFDGKYAELLKQVHFLPVTGPAVEKEYNKAEITPKDYDFVKKTVPTVSVAALLVAYDFSSEKNGYYKMRCEQVGEIARTIREHMGWLQENGHPKWKEVDPYREVMLWQRDKCAWANVDLEAPRLSSELERDLLGIIQRSGKKQ